MDKATVWDWRGPDAHNPTPVARDFDGTTAVGSSYDPIEKT